MDFLLSGGYSINLVVGVDFLISYRLPIVKSPIGLGAEVSETSIPTSKVIRSIVF